MTGLGSALRSELHLAWVIAIVTGAAVLLVTAVSLNVATLLDIISPESTVGVPELRSPRARIRGELVKTGTTWTVTITGPPSSDCVVVDGHGAARIVHLDGAGKGELTDVALEAGHDSLRVMALPSKAITLMAKKAPKPTPPSPVAKATTSPRKTAPATPTAAPELAAAAASRPAPPRPARRSAPPVLHLVHDVKRRIAITFDGGSSSNGTAELLDFLRHHNLKVTLFLTGQFIEREPTLVRQAVLEGHEVGNHTFTHLHLTSYGEDRNHRLLPGLTKEIFHGELRRTERAFRRATGRNLAPLWRAPYGEENTWLRAWALELGYLHVRWSSLRGASLDSRDWVNDEHSPLYQDSSRMMKRMLDFPRLEGGIVLMHLASDRIDPPWHHLPVFLDELARRGVSTVKVTTLLEASPAWRGWLKQARRNHRRVLGD